jgi:hypothetical protein
MSSAALQNLVNQPYKHGFVTEIEADVTPKGLNEETIRDDLAQRRMNPSGCSSFACRPIDTG